MHSLVGGYQRVGGTYCPIFMVEVNPEHEKDRFLQNADNVYGHKREEHNPNFHSRENLKSHIEVCLLNEPTIK
jgi:hypothetical protein